MVNKRIKSRIALVTGSQRGIGLETCRALGKLGYKVILTSLFPAKGKTATRQLIMEGFDVVFHPLDVTSDVDVAAIKQFVQRHYGRLDVLVNCAGILVDEGKSI